MGNSNSADTDTTSPSSSNANSSTDLLGSRYNDESNGQSRPQQRSANAVSTDDDDDNLADYDGLEREEDETEENPQRQSMWKTAMSAYEELVNAIIRPPRMEYSIEDLGPEVMQFAGKRLVRQDLELENQRGHKLQCSWWNFHEDDTPAKQLPCVISLHGNAACRIAAFPALQPMLASGISVFAMDFSGSGLSEGEFVSLGFFEREDVDAAIEYLRASGKVSTIALWGHSMGATTSLLYGDRDPSIAAMVLDSPFCDLMQLSNELVKTAKDGGMWVPGIAVSIGRSLIRRSVRKKAGFDPKHVSPIQNCSKCYIPALFAHGADDKFIDPQHSRQLHDAYAGDKQLIIFEGDHNSQRPDTYVASVTAFLRRALMVEPENCMDVAVDTTMQGMEQAMSGANAIRDREAEMMRRAMMLSMGDQANDGDAMLLDLKDGDAIEVHQSEEEMLQHAMMLSLKTSDSTRPPTSSPTSTTDNTSGSNCTNTNATITPHNYHNFDVTHATNPASPTQVIAKQVIDEAAASFCAISGMSGVTAEYYVYNAIVAGKDVDFAISTYFDKGMLAAPSGWTLPQP